MNNKKHSIGKKDIAEIDWTNIDLYHPDVVTGLLIIAGIKVLQDHNFGLALGEART